MDIGPVATPCVTRSPDRRGLAGTATTARPLPPTAARCCLWLACPSAEVQREQKKAEKLVKEAAKRNDLVSARVRQGGEAFARGAYPAQVVEAARGSAPALSCSFSSSFLHVVLFPACGRCLP
jgi:hypothetical protein